MSLFLDLEDNLFQLMHSHLLYCINGIMLYFKKINSTLTSSRKVNKSLLFFLH